MNNKINKEDWQATLRTMEEHEKEDGYVVLTDNDFIFFDEDPEFESYEAMYVTRSDVEQYIEEYDKDVA